MKQGIPEKKFCSNKRRQLQYSMAKKWPAIDSHKKAQQPQSIVFFWSTLKGAGWFDKQSGLPNPKLCRWWPDGVDCYGRPTDGFIGSFCQPQQSVVNSYKKAIHYKAQNRVNY